jgi:hypothetical protein
MKSCLVLVMGLLMVLNSVAVATAEPDFQEGLWEITSQFEMPGLPTQMPPTTHTQCITKADMVPTTQSSDQQCEVRNLSVKGNTISYDILCTAPGNEMVGHGEVTYDGITMTGMMQMRVPSQGGMQMTSKYKGRRVGPCQ